MPPSSAQYTVSVATDVEASMFVPPRIWNAKLVPTPRRVKVFSDRVVARSPPSGSCKGDHREREIFTQAHTAGTRRRTLQSPDGRVRSRDATLSLEPEDQDAGADHEDADPFPSGWSLAEEEEREHRDQHQAQLVDRRDLRGTEVADPGGAGRQPGQHQEEPRVRGERERVAPLAGGVDEPGEHDDDDRRANESGQIGIDTFEPELGEDGREGREDRGPERPVEPAGLARH